MVTVMICLATHKRPDNITRFIASYGVTGAIEPVLMMIDEDDRSYDNIVFPDSFKVITIPSGSTASRRANIPFERFPEEPYYAIMGDDIVPMTNNWDQILKAAAGRFRIAYPDDGIQHHRLATHPFIGGDLVRSQGFVEEPSMGDWYADNCRMEIGRALHLLKYVEEVKFDHMHYINGKAPLDETYQKQQGRDPKDYIKWQSTGYYTTLSKIQTSRLYQDWLSESKSEGSRT